MMKVILDREYFLHVVTIVSDITAERLSQPAYSCVFLMVRDDKLIIRATDSLIGFETEIAVENAVAGSVMLYTNKLLDIIRNIQEEKICIEETSDTQIKINPDGKTNPEYILFGLDTAGFPDIISAPPDNYVTLPQGMVKTMINQVSFAASRDELKYHLNGVYLKYKEGKLATVATNTKRLALASFSDIAVPDGFLEKGITISNKTTGLIEKFVAGEGEVGLQIISDKAFIKFNNFYLSSVLVQGGFPDYEPIIPKTQQYQLQVNRLDLANVLRQVSLFCKKTKRVILNIYENGIEINSDQAEVGKAKSKIECEYHGAPAQIAVNYDFLLEPVRTMSEETVGIGFTENNRAISVYPVGNESIIHVIMPMLLD